MSTLDTNQSNKEVHLKKTIVVYLILSIAAIVVDNIYALFGHGVRSDSMSWMFLYPLIGGTLVFLMAELLLPTEVMHADGFRLSCNLYNSGIAALTTGSLLKGILEIAGTASPYTVFFFAAGIPFLLIGSIIFAIWPLQNPAKSEAMSDDRKEEKYIYNE